VYAIFNRADLFLVPVLNNHHLTVLNSAAKKFVRLNEECTDQLIEYGSTSLDRTRQYFNKHKQFCSPTEFQSIGILDGFKRFFFRLWSWSIPGASARRRLPLFRPRNMDIPMGHVNPAKVIVLKHDRGLMVTLVTFFPRRYIRNFDPDAWKLSVWAVTRGWGGDRRLIGKSIEAFRPDTRDSATLNQFIPGDSLSLHGFEIRDDGTILIHVPLDSSLRVTEVSSAIDSDTSFHFGAVLGDTIKRGWISFKSTQVDDWYTVHLIIEILGSRPVFRRFEYCNPEPLFVMKPDATIRYQVDEEASVLSIHIPIVPKVTAYEHA
jgi:hypothetical protein